MKYYLFVLSLVLFGACQNDINVAPVNAKIENLKTAYAPDKRVARFDVEAVPMGDKVVLRGETNLPEAKAKLLADLPADQWQVVDSIQTLPSKDLDGKIYGIVNLSACNIRSNPKHSAELATQSTLGTPLVVNKKVGEWFWVQTPDHYFGWLDDDGMAWMDKAAFDEWMQSEKVVYLPSFGFSQSEPNAESARVSDLVEGNILKFLATEGEWTKVAYPDGRIAYLPTTEVMNMKTWLASREPNAENVLAKAKEFIGRPYLWGGTSGKGVDCSGFTKSVFYMNGVMLPRDASQQVHTGIEIETDTTWKNLQAGDLLFFGRKATPEKKERISHVAIYMGDGRIIHSAGVVRIESLRRGDPTFNEYRLTSFIRAKRILTSLGENGIAKLEELSAYDASLK